MTAKIISLAARRPPEKKSTPVGEPLVSFELSVDDCPLPVALHFIAALRMAGLDIWADHILQEGQVFDVND